MTINLLRSYTYKNAICLLIALYFLVLMHIYLPNRGGNGLNLPLNIFAWLWICMLMCVIAFSGNRGRFIYPRYISAMVLGCFLLTVPLFWASRAGMMNAVWRVMALWGGLFIYVLLYQLRLCFTQKIRVMWAIFGATVIEAVVSLWQIGQLLMGAGSRPGGIFQQVNVLASFLATGLAISFILYSMSKPAWVRAFLALSQIMISLILVMLSSRVGWLAGIVVYTLYLGRYLTRRHDTVAAVLLYPLLGAGVGIGIMYAVQQGWWVLDGLLVDKQMSSHLRWILLIATWSMIKAHLLTGVGYGEYAYTLLRTLSAPQAQEAWRVTHPHNEILYWWVEGGILALVGIGCIIYGILRQATTPKCNENYLWLYVMIPIALHTMTEFPFYLSMPHLFISLLCISFLRDDGRPILRGRARLLRITFGVVLFLFAAIFIFMLQANFYLYQFERSGMKNKDYLARIDMPMLQWERYQFDRHISMLLSYNTTRNDQLLIEFERWARDYSDRNNDRNVCWTRVNIAKHFRLADKYSALKRECTVLYP